MNLIRLGINIDHVATIRNARGGSHPDPIDVALLAEECGVDNITAHLREDRRHINDDDIKKILKLIKIPLNLEMAATQEMLDIALICLPNACCIVPERREEITTEGGLNLKINYKIIENTILTLNKNGIKSSLFIDPDIDQVKIAHKIGADAIEIHTGKYCNSSNLIDTKNEIKKIKYAAILANKLGMDVHAGHGLTFENVADIASINEITELNIGHFIIGESISFGIKSIIFKMRAKMNIARNKN